MKPGNARSNRQRRGLEVRASERAYLAWDVVRPCALLCAEEVQAIVLVPCQPYGCLCDVTTISMCTATMNEGSATHLRKDHSPLERRTVQRLALPTMTIFRVDWVPMELERDVPAPALPGSSTSAFFLSLPIPEEKEKDTHATYFTTNRPPSLVHLYGGLLKKSRSASPPSTLGTGPTQPVSGMGLACPRCASEGGG